MNSVISRVIITAFFVFIFLFLPKESFASLFINEFSSYPSDSSDPGWPDWVEIYNSGSESVDLSLYRLRDNTATNKLDLSGNLGPGNFISFDWSNKLNKSGDIIKLLLISSESIVDQVGYGDQGSDISAPGVDQSAGRKTDGENLWVVFNNPTKGNSNNSSIPLPTFTSTPTPSFSPTPTLKPTSTPKPTATPTKSPTSKPAPTDKPSSTQKASVSTISLANSKAKPSKYAETKNSSDSSKNYPNFVLGEKSSPSAAEKETKVLSASQNNLSKILIGIGSLFFLACGILTTYSYKKRKQE